MPEKQRSSFPLASSQLPGSGQVTPLKVAKRSAARKLYAITRLVSSPERGEQVLLHFWRHVLFAEVPNELDGRSSLTEKGPTWWADCDVLLEAAALVGCELPFEVIGDNFTMSAQVSIT
jgi:hypothetical protein